MAAKLVYSQHIFMFPFTISPADAKLKNGGFLPSITKALTENGWQESVCRLDLKYDPKAQGKLDAACAWDYSEYYYFHNYVRTAFFSPGNPPQVQSFGYETGSKALFTIRLKSGQEYQLKLSHVSLKVFETGIGILSFELENRSHPGTDDVIKINDVGRRIYPQFMGQGGSENAKNNFLADEIRIDFDRNNKSCIENFQTKDFFKDYPVCASFIPFLLGPSFSTDKSSNPPFLYAPIIDDRMFVVCWYGSNQTSEELKKKNENGQFHYLTSDLWYRFVFFDGGMKNCHHPVMAQRLIEEATYERWVDLGTFYGISRYGLVALTPLTDPDDPEFCFGYDIIRHHMRRHYAQMAAMLLMQRAGLLKFSKEISHITPELDINYQDRKTEKCVTQKVKQLQLDYIRFRNQFWCGEVSPQEQGIELYDKGVSVMRLKEEMNEIKEEINRLYDFVSMSISQAENNQMMVLTRLGAIFLPVTIVLGLSASKFNFINDWSSFVKAGYIKGIQWFYFVLSILLFVGFLYGTIWASRILIRYLKENELQIDERIKLTAYGGLLFGSLRRWLSGYFGGRDKK